MNSLRFNKIRKKKGGISDERFRFVHGGLLRFFYIREFSFNNSETLLASATQECNSDTSKSVRNVCVCKISLAHNHPRHEKKALHTKIIWCVYQMYKLMPQEKFFFLRHHIFWYYFFLFSLSSNSAHCVKCMNPYIIENPQTRLKAEMCPLSLSPSYFKSRLSPYHYRNHQYEAWYIASQFDGDSSKACLNWELSCQP